MVAASAGRGLWNRLRNDDISRYVSVGKAEVGGGLRHSAECRRAGMSCFGARCRTPRGSLGEACPPQAVGGMCRGAAGLRGGS